VWNDLRYALRTLWKNPAVSVVATVTLALGIGANSAVFSVFEQVILRLLPVANPEELELLEVAGKQAPGMAMADHRHTVHSYPQYLDFRQRSKSMAGLIARMAAPVTLAHQGEGERAYGELISGNFFQVLGLRPHLGRLLGPEDDVREGGHPVLVLGYQYWQRRFGGREDVLGQSVRVNGRPMEVVGVAPKEFRGVLSTASPAVYMTLAMRKAMHPMLGRMTRIPERMVRVLAVLGRRNPGVPHQQAASEMQAVWRSIQEDELKELGPRVRDREKFLARKMTLTPALQGIHTLREQVEKPLLSVMALVGLVLLIACVNVAGLLMARAVARGREVAVRVALGASRAALVRQVLLESLVLGLAGGVAGLVVAVWTMKLLELLVEGAGFSAVLSMRVIGFNFGVAAVTAVLFGLAPAWRATRADVATALKDQTAGTGAARGHARFRQAAVVVQVALSLLLLVAAGLFARTLHNLRTCDPGFRTEKLLSLGVDPALNGYDAERGRAFYERLTERLRRLPAVQDVGAATLPLIGGGEMGSGVRIEGYQAREGEDTGTSRNVVGPGFFRTVGIPVVLGREFEQRDREGAPRVAVVNEAFVRRYLHGQNPLGRKISFGGPKDVFDIEIVGVVKNQKSASLREETKLLAYTPSAQSEDLLPLTFYLLSERDEAALGPDVRRVVRELDADLPLFRMETVATRREEAVQLERTVAQLASTFAGMATLLAAVGLYGLMAHGVARRTREIGVRMALGAQRGQIFGVILKESLLYLAVGLVAGLPLALWLGRLLEAQLFGLTARDPVVLAGAVVALTLAALTAACVPARRAARVDPAAALRHD